MPSLSSQGPRLRRAASLLARQRGSASTRLAWRVAGVAMYLHWFQGLRSTPFGTYLVSNPVAFHVAGLGGLLLVALGPRLALLLPLAAAWSWVCYAVPAGEAGPLVKVVDEYLLYALLPLLAASSVLITWSERHLRDAAAATSEEARGQRWALRIGLSASLGFAALHKLNADFLHPATSCARLARRLSEFWSVPAFEPGPWAILTLEALAVPLLWLYPRLGLLWTVALVAGLGHIGPAGFNTLILAAALGFTPERDVQALGPALLRRAPWVVVAALVVFPASFTAYHGPNAWPAFAIFQAVLMLALALCAVGLRDALRGGKRSLSPRRSRLRLPGGPRHQGFALVTLAVLLTLGLSPYLGFHYRYSFAMLSNLRVDDARWNSLVVPRQLRLSRHDPFVHVRRVEPPVPRSKKGEPVLAPGVFTPDEFRRRLDAARRQQRRSALELQYQGQVITSPNLGVDLGLVGFAAALPDRPLHQPALTLKGRQECVH